MDFEFEYVNATDFITEHEGKEVVENVLDRIRWQRSRIDDRPPKKEDVPKAVDDPKTAHILNAFPFAWSKDALENEKDPLKNPLGVSGSDYWDMEPRDEEWEKDHPLPKLSIEQRAAKIPQASRENNLVKKTFIPTTAIALWNSHVRILRDIVEKSESSFPLSNG